MRKGASCQLYSQGTALYREGPEWINGEPCCRECGDPIPPKRLEALPGVGLCRSCQEERERELQ